MAGYVGPSIPDELLELILEKLDLVAHARFASVCSSWRSVAINNPPINKPLYLALSHDPEHLVRRFITSFIPSWKKAAFIGAALDGWLVILIDGRDLFLLNKCFNSMIPLPPLPDSIPLSVFDRPDLCKAVLSSPPPSTPSSSVECTVVIKHFLAGVFYCRLGSDKSFTKLSNSPDRPQDIQFYNGRLYVCDTGSIRIFDHLLNMLSQFITHSITSKRLLISGDNILYVVVGRPRLYSVFTLEGSGPKSAQVTNTGDDLMILCSNRDYCLSITTKEYKEFRGPTYFFENNFSNFVQDTSKDPNMAKADDPWPLFFVMFSYREIKNVR